jgi:hypothetical protein
LYLFRSLRSRISHGGIKLPLTNPLLNSLHSHSLLWTSVFLPETFYRCRAFTRMTLKLPSKMLI